MLSIQTNQPISRSSASLTTGHFVVENSDVFTPAEKNSRVKNCSMSMSHHRDFITRF